MSESNKKKDSAPSFRKEQLVRSGNYPKDLARAVLKDGKEYTAYEAEQAIKDYLERKVV